MGELSKTINIGKVAESQLNEIGITTLEELQEIGSKEAWLAIRENDSSACFSKLCGLEGAIQGIRWHNLSENDKKNLKDFYSTYANK